MTDWCFRPRCSTVKAILRPETTWAKMMMMMMMMMVMMMVTTTIDNDEDDNNDDNHDDDNDNADDISIKQLHDVTLLRHDRYTAHKATSTTIIGGARQITTASIRWYQTSSPVQFRPRRRSN